MLGLSEKFFDKNIAELCQLYSATHGYSINLKRVVPDFIDGLKPVARRSLYIMFLKDQGRQFRKLASISGDIIGRVHAHGETNCIECIVGMAQWWANNIPLIEGQGNWGSCHDSETEVLTRDGWKYFNDITKEDKLASVNPVDGTMIFENPINIIKYPYKGDMIVGSSKKLNFKVTPDHKMILQKYRKYNDKHSFSNTHIAVTADKIPSYSKLINEFYHVKVNCDKSVKLKEIIIHMEIWVQFIALYLLSGKIFHTNLYGKQRKVIAIGVNKSRRFVKEILYKNDILRQLGVTYAWSSKDKAFIITNPLLINKLESYGFGGVESKDIELPDFIMDLDFKYIEEFLCALMLKDSLGGSNKCIVKSKKLSEKLEILALMSGHQSHVEVKSSKYYVSIYKDRIQTISKSHHITTSSYDGFVYCAEVPRYHTLITRRGSSILLSGNCSGDSAAAARYIMAKLSDYAYDCFFADWKESAVDMVLAYDGETKEPLYLPAKYPNVLLNGTLGIGYAQSSMIPCFNFREVVEATIKLMKNPEAPILLIPDSPTGASIIEGNFQKISETGNGVYTMRCTYEVDSENNVVTITSLPYQVTMNTIREKIADIKEKDGLPELLLMHDHSGSIIDLRLKIRDDVNPYRFIKKLIESVAGLEKTYPVNITVTNDYKSYDLSIKGVLVEWIKYRREQKRVVVSHRKTTLLAEQRTNDVRIFLLTGSNLQITVDIFKTSRNRAEIESRLIERYRDSEIRMDSLQAKTLSEMRMHELSIESYEKCLARREELIKELAEVEETLNTESGIDNLIIGELREGIRRYGTPRRSSVVPFKISLDTEVAGSCILQLSSDGIITRNTSTNVDEEPIPLDTCGFAAKVDNDSAFVVVDEDGMFSFVKVVELPVDQEVPLNRFIKQPLGNIVGLLPFDIDSTQCCVLISRNGMLKKIRISEMKPSRRPCIDLGKNDKLVRGIVVNNNTKKDILIYTELGMGQRFDPNAIKITSFLAKGGEGFKLDKDHIVGCYSINPENQYLLYITKRGRGRLNETAFLPQRVTKRDQMVMLIPINERDSLLSVIGVNKFDNVMVHFNDQSTEQVDISKLQVCTMSAIPEKVVKKNVVSNYLVKARKI